MSNWKGISAGQVSLPSKDKNKKASVDFSCDDSSGKGANWKGKPSPAGALPAERKAIINPSNIHEGKSDRKSSVGPAPGKG